MEVKSWNYDQNKNKLDDVTRQWQWILDILKQTAIYIKSYNRASLGMAGLWRIFKLSSWLRARASFTATRAPCPV